MMAPSPEANRAHAKSASEERKKMVKELAFDVIDVRLSFGG
jgi:hypothetical protein